MALTLTITAGPVTGTISYPVSNAKAELIIDTLLYGWAGDVPEGLTPLQEAQWKIDQTASMIDGWARQRIERNALQMGEGQIEAARQTVLDAVSLE